MSAARTLRLVAPLPFIFLTAACNLILGLNDYTDRCPGGQVVDDFRECPDGGPSSSGASTGSGGGGECTAGATRRCYTGSKVTEDVGECHHGTQTCAKDSTWGACLGEQLPKPENYDKKGDENCDSFASGDTTWSELFQTPEYLTGKGIDAQGNIYIFGAYAQHDLKLGTTNLENVGNSSNVFLAKLSPIGKPIWAKRLAVLAGVYDGPQTMAVSPNGNIVLTIASSSPLDLGNGNALTGLIVAGYTTDGHLSWSTSCSGSTASLGQMAFDSTGGIVGIGSYSGSTDCGLGAMMTTGSDDSDILLIKFAGDGTPLKETHFGDFHNQYGAALVLDQHDNITITGSASGTFSFGVFPAVGDGDGDGDVFVAAFDKDFTNLWTSTWTDPQLQSGSFVSLDPDGGVFFGGAFLGTIPFGASAGTLQAQGANYNMFVAGLSDAGVPMWAHSYAGGPTMLSDGILAGVSDSRGQHIVMGRFQGTLNLGGQMHMASGTTDSFLGVLNATGKPIWSKSYGGASTVHTYFYDLALNPHGDAIITGVFDGTVDFGNGPLVPKNLLPALLVMQVEP